MRDAVAPKKVAPKSAARAKVTSIEVRTGEFERPETGKASAH